MININSYNPTSFWVAYQSNIVDGIDRTGQPMLHSNPILNFPTYSAAESYIRMKYVNILKNNPLYGIEHFNHYSIVEKTERFDNRCLPHLTSVVMSDLHLLEPDHVRGLMLYGVTYGFSVIGLCEKQKALDFLNKVEYIDVVAKTVPMHVIANIEDFLYSGIKTCTQEELSAIILTSSEEMLKELQIDRYINNTSK